jgi:hypothetical protein
MHLHLQEISTQVTPGSIAALICDGAGWHQTGGELEVPNNIVLLPLVPYSPELNPMENVWEYLRGNKLSARVWDSYEAIVEPCAEAWNFFVNDPDRIRSIGTRDWATVDLWGRWYHLRSRPTLQGDQSKTGLVEKTRLTKHWTDWVDYWAVDFDYLQRKEIKVPVGSGLSGIASPHSPASSRKRANWLWPPSRGAGPEATSSRMSGRVSARARTAIWN